jgi:Putative abortive phage resistance protein AbiGi, antitoxin
MNTTVSNKSRQQERQIKDILHFRTDISPFLVHLTRDPDPMLDLFNSKVRAEDVLKKIIEEKQLLPGSHEISDARFGMETREMAEEDKIKYFGSICFTETPLDEIHCLLDITKRSVNLSPYGLVFLKEKAISKGVQPVFYINNSQGDKDSLVQALCTLIYTSPDEAAHILPLVAIFGKKLHPKGARREVHGEVDFTWEREWRYVPSNGPYQFSEDEIFIGLCPEDKIEEFEKRWPPIEFIDPTKNIKWHATKLINARKRLKIKYSVV